MQRKAKGVRCNAGDKRFTVVVVNGDPYDSHSGRSFEQAMGTAMPDRGSRVDVYVTCARDGGEARLPGNYKQKGKLTRSFRSKRG
jgi:hypothetical protein